MATLSPPPKNRARGEDADDPDPDAATSALLVRAAQPDPAAKDEVWDAVAALTGVPPGRLRDVQQAF